ncbi:zinc finger protein 670-like [Cavia porcellus]|uniref:zinc finger protein 670-like n=1 Tax=Cavia porcellus TaxID=10141 RepID=UPI000661C20A|nr:zinc finger protein 670-like [Cavia porcellus]
MRETVRNMAAMGIALDNQEVEEDYKAYWRNLRNEEVDKCYQYKACNQYREIFFWTQDANLDMKKADLNPAENFACKKFLSGHLSLNVPIIAHTALKPYEYLRSEEKLYKCNENGRTCSNFQSSQKHTWKKSIEKPYKCGQHRKSYPHLSERIHLGEKTFVCKKTLVGSSTYNAQIHERNHRGKRPYVCKQCGQTFSKHNHRQVHEKTHAGEKPFTCKQCDKAFSTYHVCTRHEASHTGEKPYICK